MSEYLIFAREKKDQKFQQNVYVNYKLEDFIYLLDVMNSVYDKVNINRPNCNGLGKVIATIISLSFFFPFEAGWFGLLEIKETSLSK